MSRYLDLRDLAKELDDLREQKEDAHEDFDEEDRLKALESLEKEVNGDLHLAARNEPMLIPDDEWVDYCRQMAEDCGYLSDKNPLSNYIDWDGWADDMKADYQEVEFDGDTYWRNCC